MKTQHEAVALAVARGADPIPVYRAAYPKTQTDEAARVSVDRLLKRPDVAALIVTKKKELATLADQAAINELKDEKKWLFLSLNDKREILYMIAYNDKAKDVDRIRAIELDAELTGEGYRPPDPGSGGPSINQYNTTVIRKTVFNTRVTTTQAQTIQQTTPNEGV